MASDRAFRDRVVAQLNQVGDVTARAMFGGYGLYIDGIMFALIAYDTLYFKVDNNNLSDFLQFRMPPFTYMGKHKPIQMSYYQLPQAVFEDVVELATWVEKAKNAARLAAKKRGRSRKG